MCTSPTARRVSGLTTSPVEALQGVQVDHVVLDPEGVLEPLQLRDALLERELAALEAGLDVVAGALALGAAAGGLAALAGDAAPDAPPGPGRARAAASDRGPSSGDSLRRPGVVRPG